MMEEKREDRTQDINHEIPTGNNGRTNNERNKHTWEIQEGEVTKERKKHMTNSRNTQKYRRN